VATDGKNYTILLLCWNVGKESKVHDHPCDGCFIRTLRGCIKETRYILDSSKNILVPKAVKFYNENQVSYMDDYIGFHKITNPLHDMGAVSLHLYTPPFSTCKVSLINRAFASYINAFISLTEYVPSLRYGKIQVKLMSMKSLISGASV